MKQGASIHSYILSVLYPDAFDRNIRAVSGVFALAVGVIALTVYGREASRTIAGHGKK